MEYPRDETPEEWARTIAKLRRACRNQHRLRWWLVANAVGAWAFVALLLAIPR